MRIALLLIIAQFCSCIMTAEVMGRQLFVNMDGYETNLKVVHHYPKYWDKNPIVKATKPWELNAKGDPYAAPFSGGVWYDEKDELYKMWYMAGGGKKLGLITCYATSYDGKQWTKPALDVVPGTNIVDTLDCDCVTVLLDKHEVDKNKRYKMFAMQFNGTYSVSMLLKYSADGIHWSKPVAVSGELLDRCSAYYDPFRGKYVLSLKAKDAQKKRARNILAHEDPEMAVSLAHNIFNGNEDKFVKRWFSADADDPRNPQFPDIEPQIYNHDAIAYESSLLGFFVVWQGPENKDCDKLKIQKRNEVLIGWSDDGFNWNRKDKTRFLTVSEDRTAWNAGNVQSVCGAPLIVGDSLYFYMSGRYNSKPTHASNFATGLATLRRDGFVSLDAPGKEGYVCTPSITIGDGTHLFVNVDLHQRGMLCAEIIDVQGNAITGFTRKDCIPLRKLNSTKAMLQWKGNGSLASLKGQTVRICLYMKQGSLYSHWLSPWPTGESRGYTAGGGPNLSHSGLDLPK